MAKKMKFPLEMANGIRVRSLEELQNQFSLERVLAYYADGRLVTWLTDRYLYDIAGQIEKLDRKDIDFTQKLCEILGVKYQTAYANISLEKVENKNRRILKLKEYTEDNAILENVDNVAFSQEELNERLNEGKKLIYLCGDRFEIPLSKTGIDYIGINMPTAVIPSKEEIEFDTLRIKFKGIEFDDQYKKVMMPDIEKAKNLYWSGEYTEARNMFEKLAEKENAEAMLFIGLCYKFGKGVDSDEKKAFEWYLKSAEAGNPDAMNKTAICYLNGEGVTRNDHTAVEWYKKAAEAGEMYAMFNLASLYKEIKGAEPVGGLVRNNDKALHWYEKSAEKGFSKAMGETARSYLKKHDWEKALYWAEKGVEKDDYNAISVQIMSWARIGEYGRIVHFLEQRAENGDVSAALTLSDIYLQNNEYEKYYSGKKSRVALIKAAEQGSLTACIRLTGPEDEGNYWKNKGEELRAKGVDVNAYKFYPMYYQDWKI